MKMGVATKGCGSLKWFACNNPPQSIVAGTDPAQFIHFSLRTSLLVSNLFVSVVPVYHLSIFFYFERMTGNPF